MVWTAIYRNRCQYIPADERRSCPLLLCNQRFPTLELLLQHLYGCPELEAAQYWCYECQRVELFDDAQCAGPSRSCCVGHPSRRRRVLDMAKELFSSIGHHHRRSGGHRPRRTNHAGGGSWGGSGGGVGLDANNNDQDAWVFNTGPNTPFFDFNLDVPTLDVPSFVDSPPSYFDAQSSPARNGGVELQASDNQICELDSAEIPPPAIPEGFPMGAQMGSQMGSMAPPPPSSRPSGHAIEYDSSNFGSTIAPQDLTRFPTQAEAPGCRSTGRPNLQVQTAVAPSSSFRQPQPKSRSRDLAPSSSLRSTNSTNSTSSTFSNTTALSGFSQPRSSGIFTSALTTPTSEYWSDSFLSSTAGKAPHLLLPSRPPHGLEGDASHNIHGQFCDPSTLSAAFPYGDPFFSMGMSELPGTDVNSYLSMPSSAESAPGDARPQPKAEDAPQAESAPLSANDFSSSGRVSASSLIETLIDTLQVHVSETTAHLSSILSSNSTNGRLREITSQLGSMTAEKVAVQGLDIMIALSCGEHPPSSLADPRTGESVRDTSALLPAIGLLCFVHLVFAMSMLIHDSDGSTRAVDLFVQAMDYRFWTSPDDRGAFGVLVCALWKPKHMDRRQAVIFANDPASYHWRIDPSSSSGMGQPRRLPWSPDNDLGLLTARHFLDGECAPFGIFPMPML